MFQGKQSFGGGITTLRRVSVEQEAVLARCSGFDPSDGALVPEGLVLQLGEGGLAGITPEQTPIAFLDSDGLSRVIARDLDERIREFETGGDSWGSAGSACDVLRESVPVRQGRQVVFATGEYDPKLMAYEPESSSTKLRPLSFKGPADYILNAHPVVTPSGDASRQLFDMPGSNAWTAASAEYTFSGGNDVGTFTFLDTADANEKAFTKDLGSTGIVWGKYLVMDIYLADDPQNYESAGMFVNDYSLRPSGYEIVLYSNQNTTGELQRLPIPRLDPLWQVHRVCWRLSDSVSLNIKSISIDTASFFTPPTTGNTFTMKLFSYAMSANWMSAGNWIMPALQQSSKSPWYDLLTATTSSTGTTRIVPKGTNLVPDGGFELVTGWTYNFNQRQASGWRSGNYCFKLDHANDDVASADYITGITAGRGYVLDVWHAPSDPKGAHAASWRIEVRWYNSSNALISTTYLPGPTNATFYYENYNGGIYALKQNTLTAPASAEKCKIHIEAELDSDGNNYHMDFRIDDVELYAADNNASGSAWILQRFNTGSGSQVSGKTPNDPAFRWLYCFCGRDVLGSDSYGLMISNPSDPDTADDAQNSWVTADPWRTFSVAVTLPGGPVTGVALHTGAAGTGYTVNDQLYIADSTTQPGGGGYLVKVLTVDGSGAILTYQLLEAGTGYVTESASGAEVTGGTGSGAKFDVTALTPISEYGSYLTHVLIYRQTYDGETETWGSWKYIGKQEITEVQAGTPYLDAGNDDEVGVLNGLPVPAEVEITNDYASSARYAMVSDGRIYAGCLDWDNSNSRWQRKTAIEVSSWGKPWAFPTTSDEDSHSTDGSELDGYAVTGSEIRGMIARGDEKFVFLDNEFFLLRGDNPQSGWQFVRLDSIGLVSARTLADCRSMLVWHDGHHFFGYSGGLARPISRFKIDSGKIDWTKPHNAVYWQDKYVCFCEYDSANALLIFDVGTGAWRIWHSESLGTLVGICTGGSAGVVYGLTSDGKVVDLFGSVSGDLGDDTPTREVWTQYVMVGPPGVDVHVTEFVMEVEASETVTLSLEFNTHGLREANGVVRTLVVTPEKTQYQVGLNLQCDAVQVKVSHTPPGVPPTIYYMGFKVADAPSRGD